MSSVDSFGLIDYAVFIGMLLVSTAIGIYYAWTDRNKQSNDEFLMGGKKMGVIPVAMSLMASFMSSITILGYPAEIYTRGTQFWMTMISSLIATVIAAEIFLPIFYKLNMTSVNEYLYKRFNSNAVRVFASISILIASFPYLGVVLFGPSLALGAVTKLSVTSSVLIMGLICTFYTSIGGLKAVIWTDVVQFILMFAGMIVVVIKGTIDVGGLNQVFYKANLGSRVEFFNMKFDIYSTNTFWTVVLGTAMLWTGAYSTSQMQVQRSCSMPNLSKAKKALYISMPGFMAMITLTCLAGLVAYANYYDCDPMLTGQMQRPDQLMPLYVMQIFTDKFPGVPGLFVACVFSSSLSTLSSGYNALAAITWEDFLKKFFKNASETKALWITKFVAAMIGVVSVGMAFLVSHVGTILEAALALSGAQIGPLFALFCLGVFCPWSNAFGAIVGLVCGQISCLFITFGAIVHKKSAIQILPTSTDGCDLNQFSNITRGLPLELLKNATIPPYYPEGLDKIYHISPFLVPTTGFIISLSISLIVSALYRKNTEDEVDLDLVNKKVFNLCYLCYKKGIKKRGRYSMKSYSDPFIITKSYCKVSVNNNKLNC